MDALNNETRYGYDTENHLTRITDARGNATNYSYDVLGRLTGVTNPLGYTTSLQYDAVGNLTGKTDALGKQVLDVSYDALNNPRAISDALGNTTTSQYDSLSRLTSVTDPLGCVTQFNYDDLNRLKSTTDALSGQGSQDFDAHSNRTALVDPNNNRTSFSYDPADRLTARTSAASGNTNLGYNVRNLPAWKINARGQKTTYEYDAAGRLTSFTNPDGTVSFTYDQNGNLLTAADSAGTTVREYDALNRITKYIDTQGNIIEYAYDAVGNLITLTYPGGRQVQYQYDASNRLVKVTDWAGRITSYEYDPNGRLVKTLHPGGTSTTRAYDDASRLIQMKDVNNSGGIISQYDYTYDASGNLTEEKNSNENVSFTMSDAALTYGADNRLATYNGQTVVYDADGNLTEGPLAGKMVSFTYDARSRLTGAGTTKYTYDDAGNNRIRVNDGTHQTSYIVNPNAPLSQVLVRTDEQNNRTFYVYGLGLIGQESPGGVYHSYHFDHRGSTIALTDNSGQVTDRFLYAPYGELVYRSGNTATPFLFNGRYGVITDSSDLYYMRARYYNPVAKRFLSPDTLTGQVTNPQSQNRYIYCEGNPANYVDPSGHSRGRINWAILEFSDKSYDELYEQYVTLEEQIQNEADILNGDYNWWQKDTAKYNLLAYSDQIRVINELLIIKGDYSQEEKDNAQLALQNLLDEERQADTDEAVGIFLGMSGGQGIKSIGPKSTRVAGQGFKTFYAFKRTLGSAGEGMQWHHIVEQTPGNIVRFGPEAIHNTGNVIRMSEELNQRLGWLYSSKNIGITGSKVLTIRQWLSSQSFEAQYQFGITAIENISKGVW